MYVHPVTPVLPSAWGNISIQTIEYIEGRRERHGDHDRVARVTS